jgi:hypothetical protein
MFFLRTWIANWRKKKAAAPQEAQEEPRRMTMDEIHDECMKIDNALMDGSLPPYKRTKLLKIRRLLEELKMWTLMKQIWSEKSDADSAQ